MSRELVGGRYQLEERIGSGGMGVVWRSTDQVLRRRVAVKELHHTWGGSADSLAEARARSLREARAAAALRHPNIVPVHDVVEYDGRPWLVMEYVSGGSLKQAVVEGGPLPVERAADIARGLLAALAAAHAAGVIHRDVKPANVLLDENGRVMLTDFGIASMADFDTLTATGAVLGTPGYLAPEQARGKPPGPAADLFGLGATLYYALEGVSPFERGDYYSTLLAITRHDIRPSQQAGALGPLLARLLVNDPVKRATIDEALELLERGAPARRAVSRRALLAAGAAVVLGGGAVAGAMQFPRAGFGRSSGLVAAKRPFPAVTVPGREPAPLGRVLWQRDDLRKPIAVGSVVVGLTGKRPVVLDGATGAERWRGPDEADEVVASAQYLVADCQRSTQVFDTRSGKLLWKRSSEQYRASTVLVGDLACLGSESAEKWFACEVATGKQRWTRTFEEWSDLGAEIVEGLIYARVSPGTTNSLCAIDPRTGSVVSRYNIAKAIVHDLLGLPNGVLSVQTTGRQRYLMLYGVRGGARMKADLPPIDAEDEEQVSSAVTGVAHIGDSLVVSIADKRLRLSDGAVGLVAVDDKSGKERWRRQLLYPSAAVTSGNAHYVASSDSTIHQIDMTTGQTLWSTRTAGPASKLHVGASSLIAEIGQGAMAYELPKR